MPGANGDERQPDDTQRPESRDFSALVKASRTLQTPSEVNRAVEEMWEHLLVSAPSAPWESAPPSLWRVTDTRSAERVPVEERPPSPTYPTRSATLWLVPEPPTPPLPLGAVMHLQSGGRLSPTHTYSLSGGKVTVEDPLAAALPSPLPDTDTDTDTSGPSLEEAYAEAGGNVWLAAANSSTPPHLMPPSPLPPAVPTQDEEERLNIQLRQAIAHYMARIMPWMDPDWSDLDDAVKATGAFTKLLKEYKALAPLSSGSGYDEVRIEREVRSLIVKVEGSE